MTTINDDDDAGDPGAVDATENTVRDYLMHRDGGDLTQPMAEKLMREHRAILDDGIRLGSFANYVGDQILRKAGRTS